MVFFSRAIDGSRVNLGRDDVLPVGDYYFHLPGAGNRKALTCFNSIRAMQRAYRLISQRTKTTDIP